jgi:NAD(P)H-hydrate epimerase
LGNGVGVIDGSMPNNRTSPLPGVVVDSLLGTGISSRASRFCPRDRVDCSKQLPVLARDIPSGLCSDTGRVLGRAVRA